MRSPTAHYSLSRPRDGSNCNGGTALPTILYAVRLSAAPYGAALAEEALGLLGLQQHDEQDDCHDNDDAGGDGRIQGEADPARVLAETALALGEVVDE